MKILTGKDIKGADLATIHNEPISSVDLMERAAEAMAGIVAREVGQGTNLLFIIGKGNNGGDGLAMARILSNAGFRCAVHLLFPRLELSEDAFFNLERLPRRVKIEDGGQFSIDSETVVIDAMLGSGVRGEVEPPVSGMITLVNELPNRVISIDLPSGMKTEFGNDPRKIVHADITLTIEFPKLSMLLPEAGDCCGRVEIVPIELDRQYIEDADSPYHYVDTHLIQNFRKTRSKFSYKGNYGHALLVCGSDGMYGAAILAACAALRSGCGLVTAHLPEKAASALYANAPSAMVDVEKNGEHFATLPVDLGKYTTAGIGPGLGRHPETAKALGELLGALGRPVVLDADALNIIALHSNLRELIPAGSILTPHLGEFARLVGEWGNEEEKISKSVGLARQTGSIVVVKGASTMICTPDGEVFFNSTGSPGMAKGGSGDVLTGFLTGLLARGYQPLEAALTGVYIHGLAGEKAAAYFGEEGMNSGDLIDFLPEAMAEIFG